MRGFPFALALLAGLLPARSFGQPAPDAAFRAMDRNHDGRVTLEEFTDAALLSVQRQGGRRATMAAQHPQMARDRIRQRFDAIDTRRQGFIDAEEWAGRPRQ
jgi:Ca2+-binding EF-hand superfamily protein